MKITGNYNLNFTGNPIVVNGRKLIPAKDYNGTILKLTKKDKEIIDLLKEEISKLEYEHYTLSKKIMYLRPKSHKKYIYDLELRNIEEQIDSLRSEIIEIKKARFNKQTNK